MVYTPSLTGLGDRVHLLGPEVDLETHILDVVSVLLAEDLRDVVLVAHSSSSVPVTGAIERVPDRIARVVYVDTLAPDDGESWFDLIGPDIARVLLTSAERDGEGWRIPHPFPDPTWSSIPFHPLKTVTQPVRVCNPIARAIPRAFVHCTEKPADWFFGLAPRIAAAAERARCLGWAYAELPTGHRPMSTLPTQLTDVLIHVGNS
jgi:pimeloyl-ACP methyl ester carboxylesterase